MKKMLTMAVVLFALAGCEHSKDEEQGGGDRVEATVGEDGNAAA